MSEQQKRTAENTTAKDQPSLQQPVGETADGGEGVVVVTRGGAKQGHEALRTAEAAANGSIPHCQSSKLPDQP
jgi:hypothetical protein